MWEWTEIFWTYWVFLAILIGLSFGTVLMLFNKLVHYCSKEVQAHEIKGVFWFLIIELGMASGTYYIVLGLMR